jgi:hypothetical protein
MNPFIYPKTRHTRTQSPPQYSRYQTYKPALRGEFSKKCVYCRRPDTLNPDQSHFGIDHYRPKSIFPELTNRYFNLFYCCNPCNTRKGDFWPAAGSPVDRFVPNPCDHVMFSHLRLNGSTVEAKSLAGQFTLELLDLNAPQLVEFRTYIADAIVRLENDRSKVELLKESLNARVAQGTATPGDLESIADLDVLLAKTEAALNRHIGL